MADDESAGAAVVPSHVEHAHVIDRRDLAFIAASKRLWVIVPIGHETNAASHIPSTVAVYGYGCLGHGGHGPRWRRSSLGAEDRRTFVEHRVARCRKG